MSAFIASTFAIVRTTTRRLVEVLVELPITPRSGFVDSYLLHAYALIEFPNSQSLANRNRIDEKTRCSWGANTAEHPGSAEEEWCGIAHAGNQ